jgi:hypothetical protein
MIQLSAWYAVAVLQGGLPMTSFPSHEPFPLGQIWPALSSEIQTQVVGLLAHLTVQAIVARSVDVCSGKELPLDDQQRFAQNSSQPS